MREYISLHFTFTPAVALARNTRVFFSKRALTDHFKFVNPLLALQSTFWSLSPRQISNTSDRRELRIAVENATRLGTRPRR